MFSWAVRGDTAPNESPAVPMPRPPVDDGDLRDLVGATVFLCSDAARYITGQILYIDGGYHIID